MKKKKSAYISDVSQAIIAYFAKLPVLEEGVIAIDEEKEEKERRVIAFFEKKPGVEQGKKHAVEYIDTINNLIPRLDELAMKWQANPSRAEADVILEQIPKIYPDLSSKAVERLTMYVLGNACKDHGLHDAKQYEEKLVEYCQVFKTFFGIEKDIFKNESGDIALVPIPSFKLIKTRFDKANIVFNGETDLIVEDRKIRDAVKSRKGKKRIKIDHYFCLRSYLSWMHDAQELNEIVLTYTSQHSIKQLEFLIDILDKLILMKQCNKTKNFNEPFFIKKFANFLATDAKETHKRQYLEEPELFHAMEEISAIAQNMRNGVFPGIYKRAAVNELRSFLGVEAKSSKTKDLNNKLLRILPDTTIPFHSLIGGDKLSTSS